MSEWRTVAEAPEYSVSRDGLIMSTYTSRPLAGGRDSEGYRRLVMCTGGGRLFRRIATLVCTAFHGPRPPGAVVRHLDGTRTNDHADNLAWGTQRENMADKVRHGTAQVGEKHGRSILTEAAVRDILPSDATANALAAKHGVATLTVYAVRSRRIWKHVEV